MLIGLVRTVILYLLIVLALRITGKRQLGELEPSELVVAILISELAAIPMQDTSIPLLSGIIPIIVLVTLEIILSFVILKSNKIRRIITGKPSIIIYNGILNQKELGRLRLNMDDLMEELRQKSIMSIEEVRYAILETTGKLSVFPFERERTIRVSDLNLNIHDAAIPFPVVTDGEINNENLKKLGLDEKWVFRQFDNNQISDIKQILFMSANDDKNIFIIKKDVVKKG